LVLTACVGCGFAALLLGWSARTVGNGFELPWSIYARTYLPWDNLGFGDDTTKPLRALPPDMNYFVAKQRKFRAEHTVKALPAQLLARTTSFLGVWGDWRIVLVPFVVLSFISIFPELAFAFASVSIVILGFLFYAHDPKWQAYYLEVFPAFAFAIAVGLWRFSCLIFRSTPLFPPLGQRNASGQPATTMLLLTIMVIPFCAAGLPATREAVQIRRHYRQAFRTAVTSLAGEQRIVFVRYSPADTSERGLISNDANLEAANTWIVHDRHADDIRLIRMAPTRVPYLYDEATDSFTRIDTTAMATAVTAARPSNRE
jgi:hypothetical protein